MALAAQACELDSTAAEEAQNVAAGIIAADNERDIERVLGYYAEHAILMPPGEEAIAGLDKIRPRYEKLFADFQPEIEIKVDEACAGDGLAFVRGRNSGRLVSRASGEVRELRDAFLMILMRQPDGEWRISHLMWHQDGPAE